MRLKGFLSIQDESSMLVARALEPDEGDVVLDSCAAPGGKATHTCRAIAKELVKSCPLIYMRTKYV